jgi:phage shock protein C
MEKKLYRSDDNKILLGICGGIGEYFNIDPVIARLILVVLIFLGFSGIFAYIVAAFIIPKKPSTNNYPSMSYSRTSANSDSSSEARTEPETD